MVKNLFESLCGDTFGKLLAGYSLFVGAVIWALKRDINHYSKVSFFFFTCENRIAFCCGHAGKTTFVVAPGQPRAAFGPSTLRIVIKCFAYAVMFLQKRLKLFAGVQQSFSSPQTGARSLRWCYWEVTGSPKVFSPKVTAIAMVIERQAPESRSCVGTTRPFLLLVCNFSKYRPSQTSSLSQERIQETVTGLNPFPRQTQPRCQRQKAQQATPFCLGI